MTGVSKREIGTFYKLMLSILEVDGTEVQRLCPEQFMVRLYTVKNSLAKFLFFTLETLVSSSCNS
jgi:hypothetical protein